MKESSAGRWLLGVVALVLAVVLEAAGRVYEYHTGTDGAGVFCEPIVPFGTPSKGNDPAVIDGWPNQPIGDDVIVVPPTKSK